MLLLYWSVITVFSVSVAIVLSKSQVGTNGHTARTIVPSPTPNCWSSSCLTWSQCLADPSQCFTSHTTVIMLPGEYILHNYIDVFGVVSLSIYGSWAEVNGSARENQVVINCKYREGGIRFKNVTDFSLSGITMVYCGVKGINSGFRSGLLQLLYFALHIHYGFGVNLSFLFINYSTQIGLLCINLMGTSRIQDSVITHSNYRLLEKYKQGEVECSVDSWECCGTNVIVMFFSKQLACNISNLIVERTNISYGINVRPSHNHLIGTGIAFYLTSGLEYDVQITIIKCHFMSNVNLCKFSAVVLSW